MEAGTKGVDKKRFIALMKFLQNHPKLLPSDWILDSEGNAIPSAAIDRKQKWKRPAVPDAESPGIKS